MGILDFFKKKETERHFDPTNIKINDLAKGYIFEYATETWTVTALFEYDWGDDYFTREFVIKNGATEKFLNLEDDGGLVVTLSEKIKLRKLGETVCDYMDEHQKPPKKINFEGTRYFLDEKSPGFCKELDASNWEELISYDYLDESEEKTLCIEQYGEQEFEVSKGIIINELAVSNILPVADRY
ncbi:DUF4178 domain-containing protein [Tenacibaculum finnmarkense]|uniref:DUF4178 domain-containing protein n=1 Tax=Tenacibaculum finnmarkense TaxID=2781243 RepID=UPI00187B2147|nr:DUF4178 domain-containing protein [Tenacibaculum finnmarkense]MBE7632845.1 DUF4178 domain-containing protein [Tenacibaculum finnmarkense genomovar ulcerans]MCD8409865.1 DUF4178 domain-containing protein [Tenacibaculum finnmarkense genomovar ulcerans]MCD8428714.1 DUF4178 domain-containing protein [Tenacibaculum finnmarkense genomovar ulcerans]MCD8445330.1 DUF4178 domain-containing protein [Tenacibaculum finnmarkense genomovar ulcerans]WCC41793.1 DUF4178 domain-containing protein [Tenacibacul